MERLAIILVKLNLLLRGRGNGRFQGRSDGKVNVCLVDGVVLVRSGTVLAARPKFALVVAGKGQCLRGQSLMRS